MSWNEPLTTSQAELTEEELEAVKGLGLLSAKPIIYAANVADEDLASGNAMVEQAMECTIECTMECTV